MPTRSAVMVDMDMYELAKVRALELNTSFSQLTVNALERYYGLPETDYKSRYFNPNGDKAGRKVIKRHINPKVLRARRARNRRLLLTQSKESLAMAESRAQELQQNVLSLKSELDRTDNHWRQAESEIKRLQKVIQTQGQDINFWSNDSKSKDQALINAEHQRWHLQGTVEALQHVISILIKSQKG